VDDHHQLKENQHPTQKNFRGLIASMIVLRRLAFQYFLQRCIETVYVQSTLKVATANSLRQDFPAFQEVEQTSDGLADRRDEIG
jgi:hypothetical protein